MTVEDPSPDGNEVTGDKTSVSLGNSEAKGKTVLEKAHEASRERLAEIDRRRLERNLEIAAKKKEREKKEDKRARLRASYRQKHGNGQPSLGSRVTAYLAALQS